MTPEQEIELKARQLIQDEISKYREFLQTQFKHIIWIFGIIFLAGGVVFGFLIGQTKDDITSQFNEKKEDLIEQIDSQFVKLKIDKKINKQLTEKIIGAVEEEVSSEDTALLIRDQVKSEIDKEVSKSKKDLSEATSRVSEQFTKEISDRFEQQVRSLNSIDTTKILKSVSIPKGAVLAFNSPCPVGWKKFDEADRRVIVGAKNASELGELGGSEYHRLSASEMPPHSHEAVISDHRKAPSKITPYQEGFGALITGKGETSIAGQGNPFSIMQPYVKLNYCEKE